MPECPILDYSLEYLSGSTYVAWTDTNRFLLEADERLRVRTDTGLSYQRLFVKAWTATNSGLAINRKEFLIHICGLETVSKPVNSMPYYYYPYKSGGGSEIILDVKSYFSNDHEAECPIISWTI